MPAVENLVPSIHKRQTSLLKSAPVFQDLHIFIKLAGSGKLVTEQPHALVQFPYLIAVMVVRTLAAAIGEPLVYRMVKCHENLVEIAFVASVVIILGIIVDHLSDETDSHLPEGIVEFVIAQKRSTDDGTVRKPFQPIFGIHVIRPLQKGVLDIIVTRIACCNELVHPFLHKVQHLLPVVRKRLHLRRRILLPFPETAPVPHVPAEMVVVVRYLHVGGNLVMQLLCREREPVDIDCP